MHTLTLDAVVDEIVAELAKQRQRDQGYVALARAILADEPYPVEEPQPKAA